jgi:hypothetical protein
MTEADGAWIARIIARFSDELVAAFVSVGKFDARDTRYLTEALIGRRDAILRRYLSRLSPITDLRIEQDRLLGLDLARKIRIVPSDTGSVQARAYSGADYRPAGVPAVHDLGQGAIAIDLAHGVPDGGPPDQDPSRYLVVDVFSGAASGPLRAHLYDLGPKRGFRLVGLERPEGTASP